MMLRIEDWLRERRIKRIGQRLVATTNRDEKCRLYELFRAEINNRSPQQIARMGRIPMSRRMAKTNQRMLKRTGVKK